MNANTATTTNDATARNNGIRTGDKRGKTTEEKQTDS
jgi:hypothetical protein